MNKRTSDPSDDMRSEYDFSGGVRGKYAKALREQGYTIREYHADGTFTETCVMGEKTVVLEPDVWEFFQSSEAVNQTLRALITLIPEGRKVAAKRKRVAHAKRKLSTPS